MAEWKKNIYSHSICKTSLTKTKKTIMKKLLLLSCCLFIYTFNQAQIIVYCQAPAASQGNYAYTIADAPGGWTAMPDMNLSANSIVDTLMLVDDGTADDSLGCNPLINDLTGKIAVVYRRTCQFGTKAKNAQDAGAVGVIIINHSGDPVGMGPGTDGPTVTIPTVMVSTIGGAALRAQMNLGNPVVVFIGSKFGLYANDLGFYPLDALTSRVTANPVLVSANATEFDVPMGAWVHNYGNTAQTNVTLRGVISGAATYTASSLPVATLNALGDSAYLTIPTYSAASYGGFYDINYDVVYGSADGFPSDNSFYSNLKVDSLFSYTHFDPVTQKPKNGVNLGTYAPPFPAEFRSCIHFQDPNASRLAALGVYAAAGTNITLALDGESIDGLVYEWNDAFTGLSDAAFPAGAYNLNEVGSGSYFYPSNQQGEMVWIPFVPKVVLKDNQRYLFCSRTYNSTNVQLGFDNHYNYTEAYFNDDQPISIVIQDTNYYALGFGLDAVCSVTPKFASSINPLGTATINVTDATVCTAPCNGAATATVTGGTPPYNYLWATSPVQTTQTITGLCPGTYSVSISDSSTPPQQASATQTVACTSGVQENNNSFKVTPYPNPSTEFIMIPLKGMNGTAKLDIMDLSGKVVNTQTVKVAGTVSVNVKDVPSGNYIFSMLFENGTHTTFKVVVTK